MLDCFAADSIDYVKGIIEGVCGLPVSGRQAIELQDPFGNVLTGNAEGGRTLGDYLVHDYVTIVVKRRR